MKKLIVLGLAVLCLLSSCSKDGDVKKILKASELISPADKAVIKANSVKLEWAKNSDMTVKYDVYLGTNELLIDAEKVASQIAEIELTVNDLIANTTYYWKVSSVNAKGEIVESSVFSFSNGLPTKAVLLNPINEDVLVLTSVDFKWEKSSLADNSEIVYNVCYSTTNDFASFEKTADVSETKITVENLKENTKYFWKVLSKDASGAYTESKVSSFTTHTTPSFNLLLPINEFVGENPEKLTWQTVEGFTYNVYLSKDTKEFSDVNMIKRNALVGEYAVSTIEAGATYFWKIHAVNAKGTEFPSEVFSFTTEKKIIDGQEGTFTDRDGHVYKTVILNGKEWLAENYAFIPEANSNYLWMIPGKSVKDEAYANVAQDENYKKYGLLYTIESITEVMPAGWHLSTDDEWNDLEEQLGMSVGDREIMAYRGSHAAALRAVDATWTVETTNTSKMGLLAAGKGTFGVPSPVFADFGKSAWILTATEKSGKYFYRKVFNGAEVGVKRALEAASVRMSVRLVRDAK